MDLQQIILLVITILYFIFRSKGSKEKGQSSEKRKSSEASTPSLEDIIRELTGQGQNEAPAPKPIEKPVIVQNTGAKIKHVALDTSEHEEYRKTVMARERKKAVIPTKVVLSEEAAVENDSFDFDLQQAIINDAILNRPYQ